LATTSINNKQAKIANKARENKTKQNQTRNGKEAKNQTN
jgi:hypothetical protein